MWDEPDNFISVVEIENFIFDLRRSFEKNGQFLATTHNPETIKCFSDNSTYMFSRRGHLEPTRIILVDKDEEYDRKIGIYESIKMGLLEF
jgi:hypothetical protein